MTYFAEIVLKALETRLLKHGTAAALAPVGEKEYQALTVLPEPFDPQYPERRNTIVLWSLLAVMGDASGGADQIKLYCKLADGITTQQTADLLDYLNYANSMLDFGILCINDKQEITFNYSYPIIDHGDAEEVAEALELAVGCAVFALKTANMPLQKLVNDTVITEEAKNLLTLLLEIVDEHIDD